MAIRDKHHDGMLYRAIRLPGRLFSAIEKSKITLGLLGGLLTAILVGRRDAFIRRDEILRPQRAALLDECVTLNDRIGNPLIRSTYGYVDYAPDFEEVMGPGHTPKFPALPPERIPADKEEAVKWRIRKEQQPLFREIQENEGRRRIILRLIQNYTIDPRIEIEWHLIDTALDLLPGEDRFLSSLWMAREKIRSGSQSVRQWNKHIETSQPQLNQFIEHSPMAFRVFFYQQFIREHLQNLIQLILREQAGGSSMIPEWLEPLPTRPIPVISYPEIIEKIFTEHEQFRATYRKLPN